MGTIHKERLNVVLKPAVAPGQSVACRGRLLARLAGSAAGTGCAREYGHEAAEQNRRRCLVETRSTRTNAIVRASGRRPGPGSNRNSRHCRRQR